MEHAYKCNHFVNDWDNASPKKEIFPNTVDTDEPTRILINKTIKLILTMSSLVDKEPVGVPKHQLPFGSINDQKPIHFQEGDSCNCICRVAYCLSQTRYHARFRVVLQINSKVIKIMKYEQILSKTRKWEKLYSETGLFVPTKVRGVGSWSMCDSLSQCCNISIEISTCLIEHVQSRLREWRSPNGDSFPWGYNLHRAHSNRNANLPRCLHNCAIYSYIRHNSFIHSWAS